jgi:hypothetical protein
MLAGIFDVCGSVNLGNIWLIQVQLDVHNIVYFHDNVSSTCFGCYLHPSSGARLQFTTIGFVWFCVLLHLSRYWFGTALHLSTVSYRPHHCCVYINLLPNPVPRQINPPHSYRLHFFNNTLCINNLLCLIFANIMLYSFCKFEPQHVSRFNDGLWLWRYGFKLE